MTIKQLIDNLQTIAGQFGSEMEVELNIEEDATYQTNKASFLIALDNLLDDKNGNKLVIKID